MIQPVVVDSNGDMMKGSAYEADRTPLGRDGQEMTAPIAEQVRPSAPWKPTPLPPVKEKKNSAFHGVMINMIDDLVQLAILNGCDDQASCDALLRNAALEQRSLVAAILDAKIVREPEFCMPLPICFISLGAMKTGLPPLSTFAKSFLRGSRSARL